MGLRMLDFKVCRPTSKQFLIWFQHINGCTKFQRCLTQFFLGMMLVEYVMIKYPPSRVAAAAVLLCNRLTRDKPWWTRDLEVHVCSDESSLEECVYDILEILKKGENSTLQSVRKKFGT